MEKIHRWSEMSHNFNQTILLGNGASIAVNPRFAYSSLKELAEKNSLLTSDVQKLFSFFNTADFELILRLVWQAANVNSSLQIDDNRTRAAYIHVRDCLIQAVRDIHPEHHEVIDQLPTIYSFLKNFKTVVSLNYDLIVYWAIMHTAVPLDYHRFKDCFLHGQFEENWKRLRTPYHERTVTLVFYPHGNLALVRNLIESESKIATQNLNLLSSILEAWESEKMIPIFVSEGTSEQKISSIQKSYYLSSVYREVLTDSIDNLVIYGWGFGEHDMHILKRMATDNTITSVAVSVVNGDQAYCNKAAQIIHDTLGRHVNISFFDSESDGCWNRL